MQTTIKDIADLKNRMASDTGLQDAFRTDPVQAINNLKESPPLDSDVWIYRIVVIALGLTILIIIVGVVILIGYDKITDDKKVPTILTAIGSAAIGALSGLLAPSPKGKK